MTSELEDNDQNMKLNMIFIINYSTNLKKKIKNLKIWTFEFLGLKTKKNPTFSEPIFQPRYKDLAIDVSIYCPACTKGINGTKLDVYRVQFRPVPLVQFVKPLLL